MEPFFRKWCVKLFNFRSQVGRSLLSSIKTNSQSDGHSAMEKALAFHAGGWGSNPETTKDFYCSYPFGYPATCTLFHNALMHSSMNTWHRGRNCGKIIAAPSVRQNTDIRAMYEKGVKRPRALVQWLAKVAHNLQVWIFFPMGQSFYEIIRFTMKIAMQSVLTCGALARLLRKLLQSSL